jgi:hypothetical protein
MRWPERSVDQVVLGGDGSSGIFWLYCSRNMRGCGMRGVFVLGGYQRDSVEVKLLCSMRLNDVKVMPSMARAGTHITSPYL